MTRAALAAWLLALGACGQGPARPSGVWLGPGGALILDAGEGEFVSTSRVRTRATDKAFAFRGDEAGGASEGKSWRGVRLAVNPAAAVPALRNALLRDDAKLRRAAAEVLGALGAEARKAVPALVERLGDADPAVADAAEDALPWIGPPGEDQALELSCGLQSRSPRVRLRAAEILGDMGPEAARAVSPLENAAESDEEADVRRAAQRALRRIRRDRRSGEASKRGKPRMRQGPGFKAWLREP